MARKTKEESQRTRDRILDAAEHVFLSKGVASTTMSDIADFAGVSRGAVYGHYKNKIDVCIAMCDRALGEAVSLTRVSTDGEALESLYASMRQYVQIYAEEGSVQRALDVRLSNVYLHSLIEGVFGTICWSDRLKGDIWPRVERMLRAAIDTLRLSPQLRTPQAA
ncbi:TetR family transcriptional regulator [Achromobacter xylosoxidans]|uniref:TetR family transcriptional regulator n=1 Tax=Alcaligenes xylosoxydans xylosoxydans TaxID=85698 RepID=UPI001F147733|nr:TetR family transcriptional regulator [Achromobacter xylosoxidans]